jgi:uncharacterized protein YggE
MSSKSIFVVDVSLTLTFEVAARSNEEAEERVHARIERLLAKLQDRGIHGDIKSLDIVLVE